MKRLLLLSFLFLGTVSLVFAGVTLSVTGVEVPNGSTEATIGINLDNAVDIVGGVQIDLFDVPDRLDVIDVDSTERTPGFTVDWAPLDNGAVRILLYHVGGDNITGVTGDILKVKYDVTGEMYSATMIDMHDVVVGDSVGGPIFTEIIPGYIQVGMVAILNFGYGEGDAGGSGYPVDISLENSEDVGGIQMDLVCEPNLLTIDSIATTARTLGFSVDWSYVGNAVRLLLYNVDGSNIIPGDGPILQMFLSVDPFALSGDVQIGAINVEVGNPDGVHVDNIVNWNTFTIVFGYLYPPRNLMATSGLDGVVPLQWEEPGAGVVTGSILLVDDDGSAWIEFTDAAPIFMAALDAVGFEYDTYETMTEGEDGPALEVLEGYDIVIWFTGEAWQNSQTLTDVDEGNLGAFIDNGGRLFLSAQDYFYDRYPSAGAFSAGQFPYDYLYLCNQQVIGGLSIPE